MLVIFPKNAHRQYNSLLKIEQQKISKKLLLLEVNPTVGKKLTGEFIGIRSLRAWPYRILYEINETKRRVEVHKIVHRQGAYK